MANPHKGEVSFTADGKEYTLSLSANAFCELEEALGKDTETIMEEFSKGKNVTASTLRIMFWKALEDYHDGISFEDVKSLLKHIKPAEMGELLGKTLVAAMPASGEATPSPPAPGGPQDGTGPASSTDGSSPASLKPNSGS